jgi:hypothetical protein
MRVFEETFGIDKL